MLFNAAKVDIFTRPGESRGTQWHPVAPRGPAVTSTLASFFSSGGFPLVGSRPLGLGLGLFFLVYPKPAQLN